MALRAPLEKLPLAARKDLRDNWESKKPEFEKKASDLLGTPWTIEADPLVIAAYNTSTNASAIGVAIATYFERGINKIEQYVKNFEDDGKSELNAKANKHVWTLAPDDTGKEAYCGCDIKEGKLRIIFNHEMFGSWESGAMEYLSDAVDKAAPPAGSEDEMSFDARQSIKKDYDAQIGPIQAEISKIVGGVEIKLNPNWEANYAILSKKLEDNEWKKKFGSVAFTYFQAVRNSLVNNKFEGDSMLQEGFQEAVDKNEIKLQALEKLKNGGDYNEGYVDGGILYINSTVPNWGFYVHDPTKNIIDLL